MPHSVYDAALFECLHLAIVASDNAVKEHRLNRTPPARGLLQYICELSESLKVRFPNPGSVPRCEFVASGVLLDMVDTLIAQAFVLCDLLPQ